MVGGYATRKKSGEQKNMYGVLRNTEMCIWNCALQNS